MLRVICHQVYREDGQHTLVPVFNQQVASILGSGQSVVVFTSTICELRDDALDRYQCARQHEDTQLRGSAGPY